MSSARDSSLPAAAPARPAACSLRVDDLVHAVLSGRLRVPELPLRWSDDDALVLLDSIDRGYPIGTLLAWQRPAAPGPQSCALDPALDSAWVIDGHQRLQSLVRMLVGTRHPDELHAGFYDLEQRRFKHLPRAARPAPHDLPLTELLEPRRLLAWLDAHPLADRLAALRLGERLREYPVPVHLITTADEGDIRELLRRTNRTAKQDDQDAVLASVSREGLAPKTLADVARDLTSLEFGPLDEDVLRNMLFETSQSMLDLERITRAALGFLRDDAGIPHVSLVPVPSSLRLLAHFFHRFPAPHVRTRELLARWLWRDAIAGPGTGDPSRTDELRVLAVDDEHAALAALLKRPGHHAAADVTRLDALDFATTGTRLHLLALLDLAPRDLATGERVLPSTRDELDAYYRLVRPIVATGGSADHGIVNHMLHPPGHGELAHLVAACEDFELLATHAISATARQALEAHDYASFLRLRRAELLAHLRCFLDRRAQWDEPDTPPVEALRIGSD